MSRIASPKKKRTLKHGTSGKDVQAVQRALQAGLRATGLQTVLAVTGNFGDGTKTDMQTWQRISGIEASGEMGQPTLDTLWPHTDDYGTSLYLRAKLGEPTHLANGTIRKGAKGDQVRAFQQACWRMLGGDSQNARNSVFGDGLQRDIQLFAKLTDQKISTDQITQGTWECCWAFMDDYAMGLARKAASSDSGSSSPSAIRSNLVTLAETYAGTRASYTQKRPYDQGALAPVLYNDCSSSTMRMFKLAGAPDPSGRGYNGYGYTGDMQTRGTRISLDQSALQPGDCIFYGDQGGGVSQHVVFYVGSGRVFTFGGDPPTITSYSSYWTSGRRTDIGARRYFG